MWLMYILCTILILLTLLRLSNALYMVYLRDYSMCTQEEFVFCSYWVDGSVYKSSWLIVLFKSISLIFCIVVLSIIENRILKSPTIITKLSILLFKSVFAFFSLLLLDEYMFRIYIFLIDSPFYYYKKSLLSR